MVNKGLSPHPYKITLSSKASATQDPMPSSSQLIKPKSSLRLHNLQHHHPLPFHPTHTTPIQSVKVIPTTASSYTQTQTESIQVKGQSILKTRRRRSKKL